ncbi:hypothetical protein VNO77_26833 [Canavalia gladiata]|uniref:Apple domain-containing protein n=1 Tax=Canavalia gladiata TaxID=3824 RepID=A0AAN9KVT5_CANGL
MALCLKNCSCTAYANLDVKGSGCLLWFDKIVDLTKHTDQGQDIYIRLAASELDHKGNNRSSDNKKLAGALVGIVILIMAWRLWIEEKPLELIDDLLNNPTPPHEIMRCIHVGLLCVQQIPENRPNMSSVVLMLNGEKLLPEPSQPGFYTGTQYPIQVESSTRSCGDCSQNEASVSLLEAR